MAFNISNAFAKGMVLLSEKANAVTFETRFQQLQKTVINRSNDKIDRLEEEFRAGSREREALVDKANGMIKDINRTQQYIVDNQSNFGRLEDIVTTITELQVAFGTDGDSADVTAADITKFEKLRDELYDQVNNLRYLTHPDTVKPYGIIHFKEELSAIAAMTPEVGASTDTANQDITDYLATISTQATNAMDSTRSTISMGSKLSLRLQSSLADVRTAIDTKNTLAQEQLNQDIDNIKVDAANFLQAISLSYDAQAYSSNYLSNALANGIEVPKNSILNIFT